MPNAIILDDNPTNLIVLKQALQIEGFDTLVCEHPNSFYDTLEELDSVDLVFLDLEFPNFSGTDLISDYKLDSRLSEVPFVAYTVHRDMQNAAADAGFHSFIGKPLNIEKFPEHLSRIMSGVPVWEVD